MFNIGCAGWGVASGRPEQFPTGSSVLQRYAARLSAVEINSSFYRPHRRSTYERWAASVPEHFRFSVKLPKAITHLAKLQECRDLLSAFVDQTAGLGHKLGCLLVQLPPSLAFDPVHLAFFRELSTLTLAPVVCEPRHPSWFTPEVDAQLAALRIGRVAADPAITPQASVPVGFQQMAYYRWHGSPRMYYSAYPPSALQTLAQAVERSATAPWVIFDNTAAGAAVDNAFKLLDFLSSLRSHSPCSAP